MHAGNPEMAAGWANERDDLFRRSYGRGLPIFFYGLIWLGVLLVGQLFVDRLFGVAGGLAAALTVATWLAALAGGIGGATAMLSRLYRHVAIRQDFMAESLLFYFVQPVSGLVVGILSFFLITIPGALIVDFLGHLVELIANFSVAGLATPFSDAATTLRELSTSSTFTALTILLAWTAGFYHQQGLARFKSLLRRSSAARGGEPAAVLASPASVDEDSPFFFKHRTWQRRQMIRWAFTWGLFILFYGLVWLAGLLAAYLLSRDRLFAPPEASSMPLALIGAVWPVAVAGGLGGVFGIFYDLYQHVSVKQDFDRQHLMSYLAQPVIGFVFGAAIYFVLASGYLAIVELLSQENGPAVVDAPTLFMAQLVLGWVAGFRQHVVAELIERIVEGILAFFRSVIAFFNPKKLFDKTKREEGLAEVEAGQQQSIFATLEREGSVWAVEERSVWGEREERRS